MSGDKTSDDKAKTAARKAAKAARDAADQLELELIRFNGENAPVDLSFDWSHETVWATQKQIADLFGINVPAVSKHLTNIFESGELDPAATVSKMEIVRAEGGRQVSRAVEHYNLDVILSVGYRVSSQKATAFRKWATQTLKSYLTDGYALNERRLKDSPTALRALAAKVRELRSDEKQIYESVRECFKIASSDYDSKSDNVRSFYAKLQDKFLFAITGETASQIILERADGKKPRMGVQSALKAVPSKQEAKVGKNYLNSDELYVLHILCEQFMLYAESRALRGKTMTMAELGDKLDSLLRTNDYPVFSGYKDYLKERAMNHAELEWSRYITAREKGQIS